MLPMSKKKIGQQNLGNNFLINRPEVAAEHGVPVCMKPPLTFVFLKSVTHIQALLCLGASAGTMVQNKTFETINFPDSNSCTCADISMGSPYLTENRSAAEYLSRDKSLENYRHLES